VFFTEALLKLAVVAGWPAGNGIRSSSGCARLPDAGRSLFGERLSGKGDLR